MTSERAGATMRTLEEFRSRLGLPPSELPRQRFNRRRYLPLLDFVDPTPTRRSWMWVPESGTCASRCMRPTGVSSITPTSHCRRPPIRRACEAMALNGSSP